MSAVLRAAPFLWRREYFGCFLWSKDRSAFFKLEGQDALVWSLVRSGVPVPDIVSAHARTLPGLSDLQEVDRSIARLLSADLLLLGASPEPETGLLEAYEAFHLFRPKVATSKPVWVHLQPFTFCNLSCSHCYCNSSPSASKFRLDIQVWRDLIRRFDEYGIAEVFITGGETTLLDGAWELLAEIRSRGMGTGISTNAVLVTPTILDRLRELSITRVQVSIDGCEKTHEFFRGRQGQFHKTISNIAKLASIAEPVINTTVNQLNLHELDGIVKIGKSAGARKFKFFPQKRTGRAASLCDLALSDKEILGELASSCRELSERHGVDIETTTPNDLCGSGRSGFAVDEIADVYPCIFGIGSLSQRAGNLLQDSIDDLWFDAQVMVDFRKRVAQPCHNCEDL